MSVQDIDHGFFLFFVFFKMSCSKIKEPIHGVLIVAFLKLGNSA